MARRLLSNAMHRQVLLLAASQGLAQTVSVLIMTIGGLAGGRIAADPQFATAPIAAMFLGTALATVPASMWMARAGRRTGFTAGALIGAAGGMVAAAGIYAASLALLSLGTLLVGTYMGFAQFYRFAASEVADDAFRPRAISLVLAGGVVAALLGPLLGRLGGPLLDPFYLGSFLILAVLSLIAAALLAGLRIPPVGVEAAGTEPARPFASIIAQPAYLVALFGAATGYGVMILAMTATPLAMAHHNHDLTTTATVIQLHVLAMFLPSFFTGSLIGRFGVLRIMFTGVVLFAGHIALSLTGTGFPSFASALILLGLGWNFLYVGGTTLLTRTYTAAEKGRAQAANDMIVFTVGLGASLGAGLLHAAVGWQAMNVLLLPWLALAGGAIAWLGWTRRAGAIADVSSG
jgi:MFS family permease